MKIVLTEEIKTKDMKGSTSCKILVIQNLFNTIYLTGYNKRLSLCFYKSIKYIYFFKLRIYNILIHL